MNLQRKRKSKINKKTKIKKIHAQKEIYKNTNYY